MNLHYMRRIDLYNWETVDDQVFWNWRPGRARLIAGSYDPGFFSVCSSMRGGL